MDTIARDPRLRHDFLARPAGILIDGKLVPAASGKTFAVYDPATGTVIANVPEADKEDVDRAVAAARRIEAHIFIAFLAYCLQITLQRRLHALAPGLTARCALKTFAAVQKIYVHLPTTDGRDLRLTRYTQPEPELQLLIRQLKLQLPPRPPPRITAAAVARAT